MLLRTCVATTLLSVSLAAQMYTVSPAAFTSVSAGGGNTFPWNYPSGRYQQVHGDLRGSVRVITGISWRRTGVATTYTTATARTVDIELLMCDGDSATVSATFASNYAGVPKLVVNRKTVNLPDFTLSLGSPAPWSIVVPCDVPYVALGTKDLLWEYLLYSNTATGSYFCDYGNAGTTSTGTNVVTGAGCIATGGTVPMSIAASQSTNASTRATQISWTCSNTPPSAVSAILVGFANPSLSLPVLCAPLYVDQVVLTVQGTSTAGGQFTSGVLQFPYGASFAGLVTHAQGASADPGQPVTIPFAVSNAVQTTWAPLSGPIARIYASGSTTAVSGALGNGNGLVTRFTH